MVDMSPAGSGNPSKQGPLWAYAYQLLPPRATGHGAAIRALVRRENAHARRNAREWAARLVREHQGTHLLILCGTPELDRAMNHRLEARLRELEIRFAVTLPMRVDKLHHDTESP
jgi:hypothetical protein